MDAQRHDDLIHFYSALDRLEHEIGGARRLAECSGTMEWPARGVYFLREGGEARTDTGSGPRIVQVGTHSVNNGAATKLWQRLSQHRGDSNGGGNHRRSNFRWFVGGALVRRDGLTFPTWGCEPADTHMRRSEVALERKVSEIIGNMSVLWLPIGDRPRSDGQRGYIERNAVALLSNYRKAPLDPPSKNWLGNYSDRERVRSSGLWNRNYVGDDYDTEFLGVFDELVSAAIYLRPARSLSPG